MATTDLLANLKARREEIGVELAALTNATIGGKPNAGSANQVDHVGWRLSLYKELEEIDRQIARYEGGFAESVTYGSV
ncbi:hypothetical protein [Botrimarina mediterranea]|uniref:hypothetical protein n=1 Tax=Botrimarina mediterranea TaxID=2528022 RepID=UPI00118A8FB4|nr:hypothetical protein K2D_16870 [Planctomycetes bacterium K2D]